MKKNILLLFSFMSSLVSIAGTYTTRFDDGGSNFYNATSKWDDGSAPFTIVVGPFNFSNNTYNILHTVSFASQSVNVTNSTLTVKSGATLKMNSLNNSTVIVEAGGSLILSGNASQTSGGSNKIINYGTASIAGSASNFSSIETRGNGTTTIGGDVDNTSIIIAEAGTLTVGTSSTSKSITNSNVNVGIGSTLQVFGNLSEQNTAIKSFVNAGTATFAGSTGVATITNTGTLIMSSLDKVLNATLAFTNSGTTTITTAQDYSGDKRNIINSGTLNFNSTLKQNNSNNNITNTGTINITSTFTYNDGAFNNNAGGTVNIGGNISIATNNTLTNAGNIKVNGALAFNYGTIINTSTGSLTVNGTGSFLNSNAYFKNAGSAEFTQLLTVTNAIIANSISGDPGHINAKGGIHLENAGCISGGTVDYWGGLTSNNGFSQCNLSATTTLPIELNYLIGQSTTQGVELSWQTASEVNNNFFTIEKSPNGLDYKSILTTNGSGTKSTTTEYSAFDTKPSNGLNYYRLKQTDFNGESRYFAPIAVNYSSIQATIYPTVLQDNNIVTVQLGNESEEMLYQIYSQEGKIITTGIISGTIEISSDLFQYGVNQLIIGSGSNLIQTSIVKQ